MRRMYCILITIISIFIVSACASYDIKGTVVGVRGSYLTIKKENGRLIDVKVKNSEDITVLDTVFIKDKKAIIKEKTIEEF